MGSSGATKTPRAVSITASGPYSSGLVALKFSADTRSCVPALLESRRGVQRLRRSDRPCGRRRAASLLQCMRESLRCPAAIGGTRHACRLLLPPNSPLTFSAILKSGPPSASSVTRRIHAAPCRARAVRCGVWSHDCRAERRLARRKRRTPRRLASSERAHQPNRR